MIAFFCVCNQHQEAFLDAWLLDCVKVKVVFVLLVYIFRHCYTCVQVSLMTELCGTIHILNNIMFGFSKRVLHC